MDEELERFKTDIDLRQYAGAAGYAVDVRESSKRATVMRRGADKISVRQLSDGHYVYFSWRDESDNGTIIDFVQRERRCNFAEMRAELRRWLGGPEKQAARLPPIQDLPPLVRGGEPDLPSVRTAFERAEVSAQSEYLRARGLAPGIAVTPRFNGRIRVDARGNVLFLHANTNGPCGFEKVNTGWKGFSPGGEKGLFLSHGLAGDERLVICESGIEALSHATLFPDEGARYASVGGRMSAAQMEFLTLVVSGMRPCREVVAAMNADEAGRALARMVESAVKAAGRSDVSFHVHEPEREGADWNDLLRERSRGFGGPEAGRG